MRKRLEPLDTHGLGIMRADEDGEVLGPLPLGPSWKRQGAPPPDPRPALRSPDDESSSWGPVILKATLDEDSRDMAWAPIDQGIRISFGRDQLRPVQTQLLLSGVTQASKHTPHRSILRTALYTRSMFDQIVEAPPPRPDFHPVHATKFIRRLILAKMTLIVDIYLRQSYTLTVKAMQNISKIADFDPQRLSDKPWQDEWRSEFFNRLWELRGNIELLGFDVENTVRLFSDLANDTSWPDMQNLHIHNPNMADGQKWHQDRSVSSIKIRDQDLEDLKAWEQLEATRKYAAGFIERTTNSYLQAATAEGAKFSNIQAKTYVFSNNIIYLFSKWSNADRLSQFQEDDIVRLQEYFTPVLFHS